MNRWVVEMRKTHELQTVAAERVKIEGAGALAFYTVYGEPLLFLAGDQWLSVVPEAK